MADELAQFGADLDALMEKAHLLKRAHTDVLTVNRPLNDLIGAVERLGLVADFVRHLYEGGTPAAAQDLHEPMPHERGDWNPALQDALRRDGS